jgi:hypothetical protein
MANKKVAEENTGLAFLATGEDNSHIDMESNAGNEAVRQEDMQVPRLKLAQLISDEIKEGDPSCIKGCKGGDYFHSATRELFGEELYVINVFFKTMYNVWKDRKKQGGGLVGSFEREVDAQEALNEACVVARIPLDDRKLIEENFQLKVTGVHHLAIIDPATSELTPVIFDMDSSKLSISKKWNSTLSKLKGERFAHVWKLKSFMDSNDRNEDYYNVAFEHLGFVTPDIMAQAKVGHSNIIAENQALIESRVQPSDSHLLENSEEKAVN